MSIPPLNLNMNSRTDANPVNNSSTVTPMNFITPWNQVKNYQNHSQGSQTASASATSDAGASAMAPLPIGLMILAAGAYLILR